jgi:phosphatidylserine/phosphatidylglycerophosphate/cardiolipin synthase-like enzyme
MTSAYSHIASAAIQELKTNHQKYHEKLWAKTSGRVIGQIQHGPKNTWAQEADLDEGHSNWLPDTIAGLLAKTEVWCDFVSLSPPDDYFLEKIKGALATLANKCKGSDQKIVVRFLFGNIISVPVNCDAVMKSFTEGLPESSNLQIWVGSWRRGMCWNHAKIVAVDGKHVHTGGHNLWDPVYLRKDPVHDTSIEMEGEVAVQAHLYANAQWEFIQKRQSTLKGWFISKCNDGWLIPTITRVNISEWPKQANTFAPQFEKEILPSPAERSPDDVNILSIGRYGKIGGWDARSSDDAFLAMFNASKKSIRFLLQDLGPVNGTVLGKKIVYKSWPKNYFESWSKAMYERDVDVEIVLSNPGSLGGGAGYSNGWSCEEVAAEIIKTMKSQYPTASDDELKAKVKKNLRMCFLRNKRGNTWETTTKIGLHSKFFIVDDVSTYVGSQNLYQFDLAEWGVVIDDEKKTAEIKEYLWNPMWSCSYGDGSCDCNEDTVMELLGVDRDPHGQASEKEIARMEADIDLATLEASPMYGEDEEECGCCVIS